MIHCQNAEWATHFLLHKFNITAQDDLVGTDFGKYAKYKRPERRGGKPFLSGKSWKTTPDPWRGISRTSFGLDYLKHYKCPNSKIKKDDQKDKMFELNYYDEEDQPKYGWDVYVQRLSCYIQHREPAQSIPSNMESPYEEVRDGNNQFSYVPDLQSLDNGNTIIIFENSQSGSIEDTAIAARQQWESKWRRLPFYLHMAHESRDVSHDDSMSLECMKIILQDIWTSIAQNWESFIDVCGGSFIFHFCHIDCIVSIILFIFKRLEDALRKYRYTIKWHCRTSADQPNPDTHVSILEEKIYEQPADESRAPELWTNSSMWLKVERLVSIHQAVLKEMQQNLKEFSSDEDEADDDWLELSPSDMEKISDLIEENLTKPTANLADLMYKSVGIRDSRHSLQLNTSLWRLR